MNRDWKEADAGWDGMLGEGRRGREMHGRYLIKGLRQGISMLQRRC